MARQEYLYQETTPISTPKKVRARDNWMHQGWFRLLAFVMLAELFMPFLVWPLRFPRAVLGVSEMAAALAVLVAFAYMMKDDRVPAAMLLIGGVTLVWGMMSAFEGQSLAATVWGWWGMFKYPLLGVFAYLVRGWPVDFARWFLRFCILLLVFQIGVQLALLAAGFPVGDSLAGTFGHKGVMQFSMMVFFIVALAFGHWLATYKWKTLVLVLALGLIGSTLNGTKFYLIAAGMLAAAALVIHMVRGGQLRQLFLYIVLVSAIASIALPFYNSYLQSRGRSPLQEMLTLESIEGYLFTDGTSATDSSYNIGRGLAITYGWEQIQRDWTTTLFGYGLGTRTQSTVLGIRGTVLQEDVYGVGTISLGTWLQEYGIIGLIVFFTFALWTAVKLFRFARATSDPYQSSLAYGLVLYTLFWPVWLFYHKSWSAGTMMTLYWVSLGYTFHLIYAPGRRRVTHSSTGIATRRTR